MSEFSDFGLLIRNDLPGLGLYFGYLVATGLPAILLKLYFKIPFEVIRKMYHMVIVLSIFPLVLFFKSWCSAVFAALLLMLIIYPLLVFAERFSLYKRIAPRPLWIFVWCLH